MKTYDKVVLWLYRHFCSLNYRFCMADAYLASHRGESAISASWQASASEWEREYQMAGRSLI